VLGRSWEVLVGAGRRRWRLSLGFGAANVLLSLLAVLSGVGLDGLGSTRGVVARDVLDLLCLVVENAREVVNLLVDDLPVGNVDQWGKVCDSDGDQSNAPEWSELDEDVSSKRSKESLCHVSTAAKNEWDRPTVIVWRTFSANTMR
jgi:hypothetical protein